MKKLLFFICLYSFTFSHAQSESVILAPQYIDLSDPTSQSAILMNVNKYLDNTTRYRLYNGSSFYYCWDPDVDSYITSNAYSNNPLIPGDETTVIGSTWWLLFQRGSNTNTSATFGTRISPYLTGYSTLSNAVNATSLINPFNLTGNVTAGGGYDLTVKYTVLGFDAITGGNLLCAASTDLTSGYYSLVCHGGTTIMRIEFRTIDNVVITSETNASGWTEATSIGSTALPVELSAFSASIISEGVKLYWRTETEVNNFGFEIERQKSEAGSHEFGWGKIGFVEGHGNSNSFKEYQYVDKAVTTGNYSYRLKQIDIDGAFTYSNLINIELDVPLNYELSQNYPNPFNPVTTIKFNIPNEGYVRLDIFNVLGEKVKTLVNEVKSAGIYTINFDAEEINSGIYFCRLHVNDFSKVIKMNLLK